MQKFLIEFRLHGYAKYYAKNLSKEISESFNIPSARRVVPHITLYGPATTNDIKRVISIVQRIGQKYTLVPFTINGFGNYAEHSNVIYLDVAPSSELKALRQELSDALQKISSCSPFDKTQEFGFHSTIALKVTSDKLSQIWNYIKQKKAPNIQQHLLRITILRYDRTILCEYDLVLKKMLSRRKALSRFWWRRTISKYKDSKLLKTRDAKSIYFIGDLHLYHANIIKYCGRPFSNVHEMNRVLISNWRHAIKADDTVYFLGDLPFYRSPRPAKYWLPKLTGDIHFIRGNHDNPEVEILKEYEICKFGQYKFYLVQMLMDCHSM